jgi:hypothetical protein
MGSISFGTETPFVLPANVFDVCEFELAEYFKCQFPQQLKLFTSSGTEMCVRTNTCSYTSCPCISNSDHCWLVSPESSYYITYSSVKSLSPFKTPARNRTFSLARMSPPGSSRKSPPGTSNPSSASRLQHFSSYPISPDSLFSSVASGSSVASCSPQPCSSQEKEQQVSYNLSGRMVFCMFCFFRTNSNLFVFQVTGANTSGSARMQAAQNMDGDYKYHTMKPSKQRPHKARLGNCKGGFECRNPNCEDMTGDGNNNTTSFLVKEPDLFATCKICKLSDFVVHFPCECTRLVILPENTVNAWITDTGTHRATCQSLNTRLSSTPALSKIQDRILTGPRKVSAC